MLIYKLIPMLMAKYPDKDLTIDELSVFFFNYYPRLKPEEIDAFQSIFMQAAKAEVSEAQASDVLRTIEERAKAVEIAQHALDVSEGRKEFTSLHTIMEARASPREQLGETDFISDELSELKNETVTKAGLRWRLHSLNRSLGSLRLGDFGFVFARPETGKTTFLASEVTFFAGQVTQPILWFNNEEQGNKVKLRCFQAALGVPLEKLFSDVESCQVEYDRLTGRRIKIYDSGTIFRSEAEEIIKAGNPSLIIFDQIDKIRGFDADRNDLVMGSIYQWARQLAKTYAPVIGICQSDGTGEGTKWLTMSNVADAKTAKQAEADWILGIGRIHNEEFANVRHFNISKNKLMGDADTESSWRHARFDVLIEPEIARYRDLG